MAAERAEHEQAQVQMQVQVRARMPLLPPPVLHGVGGSDAYRAEAEPFTAKRSGTG